MKYFTTPNMYEMEGEFIEIYANRDDEWFLLKVDVETGIAEKVRDVGPFPTAEDAFVHLSLAGKFVC